MQIVFKAIEAGFVENAGGIACLMCGASGTDADCNEHYVTLQRGNEEEDPDDDLGVHFEFDDQINGNYECVSRCQVSRTRLHIELARPIDLERQVTSITVDLRKIKSRDWKVMAIGLRRIFRNKKGILRVSTR